MPERPRIDKHKSLDTVRPVTLSVVPLERETNHYSVFRLVDAALYVAYFEWLGETNLGLE